MLAVLPSADMLSNSTARTNSVHHCESSEYIILVPNGILNTFTHRELDTT